MKDQHNDSSTANGHGSLKHRLAALFSQLGWRTSPGSSREATSPAARPLHEAVAEHMEEIQRMLSNVTQVREGLEHLAREGSPVIADAAAKLAKIENALILALEQHHQRPAPAQPWSPSRASAMARNVPPRTPSTRITSTGISPARRTTPGRPPARVQDLTSGRDPLAHNTDPGAIIETAGLGMTSPARDEAPATHVTPQPADTPAPPAPCDDGARASTETCGPSTPPADPGSVDTSSSW